MAFKMKGSPIKLGGIQGTSGHRSALKDRAVPDHTWDEKIAEKQTAHNKQHSGKMVHDDGVPPKWWKLGGKKPRNIQMETKYKNPDGSPKKDDQGNPLVDPDAPTKMKSPLEQRQHPSLRPTDFFGFLEGDSDKKKKRKKYMTNKEYYEENPELKPKKKKIKLPKIKIPKIRVNLKGGGRDTKGKKFLKA